MIDNNIIQSLGAGSGIDSRNIVKQLTEIERSAPQERIDNRKEKAETQISDFGLLANAMDTLKSAVTTLSSEEGMYSKTGNITDTQSLQVTAEPDAQNGSYTLQVQSIAQSQSVVFSGFASDTDAVGEGTLTFNFGQWNRDEDDLITTFDADPDEDAVEITIDSNNNSLKGLRDAINDADMGVQASIVNDGSSYRLVLTAESGAENEIYIEADDTGDADNTDDAGISRFAFNENITDYNTLETQSGEDATLSINGLAVSRSTNSITDVIPGLTFDLLEVNTTEKVSLTIDDDKAYAETNVRAFVDAYNTFLEEVEPLFSYNEEEESYGSLYSDSLAKSVLSQFRSTIAGEISGLADGNYTALTNVGIRTELDGSLTINEDDFSDAFSDNFDDVQKLFSPYTSSSASFLDINSFGKQTEAGEYTVVVTSPPAKGWFATAPGAAPAIDVATQAKDYNFEITVDDVSSATITIPSLDYASESELAEALQSAINSDSAIEAGGVSVNVSYDSDTQVFTFTSNRYGESSRVAFSNSSADFDTDFLISDENATSQKGTKVAGTIDGVPGFGLGNVLLPKLGSDAEGLSMIISESATTDPVTVNYSKGFASQLETVMKSFLQTNGLFDKREEVLTERISSLEEDQKSLDTRMSAYEERLMRQFIAMENILNGLNSQGGFLENLTKTLPFTSGND